MRKKVLGLVMAALAISTIGAFAQTETTSGKPCCEQTADSNKDKKECKKDKKDGKKHGKKHGKDGKKFNPFEGIDLTAEQQQQIDALQAERKAQKEAAKADKKGKDKDKGKSDADRKAAREAQMKEYDAKIASILTPEQYTQYEANRKAFAEKRQARLKEKAGKMKGKGKKEHKAKDKKDFVE